MLKILLFNKIEFPENFVSITRVSKRFCSILVRGGRCYQSGPGSDGNERVLCIPQSSRITGTSPSDCLVSYPGHSLGGSYSSAEKKLAYSSTDFSDSLPP